MRNNKGFSLVELIIVIAIMAVLVGVIAPNLIKYIEKSNVSADIQLCDTIHDAIVYTAADMNVRNSGEAYSLAYCELFWRTPDEDFVLMAGSAYANTSFALNVAEIVGFNPFAEDGRSFMKSRPAHTSGTIRCHVNSDCSDFIIYIDHSDNSGERRDYTYASNPDMVISNK